MGFSELKIKEASAFARRHRSSFVSLDAGTIVEYVDLDGGFHSEASAIFDGIGAGEIVGLIAHPIFA